MTTTPKEQGVDENDKRTQPINSSRRQSQLHKYFCLTNQSLYWRLICLGACVLVVASLVSFISKESFAQGTVVDPNGHCLTSTGAIYACWNFQAGAALGENIGSYSEFLPNLHGWDYRINLPHVRFQRLRSGAGSPV